MNDANYVKKIIEILNEFQLCDLMCFAEKSSNWWDYSVLNDIEAQ